MQGKRHIRRLVLIAVLLPSVFTSAIQAEPTYFDGCGYLVQGVECVLFAADGGGQYVLENLGNFVAGDRIRVRGVLDLTCATIGMQGDGCISNNAISLCPESDLNADGTVSFPDVAALTVQWRRDCDEQNNGCNGADVSGNGVVDFCDLAVIAEHWLADLLPSLPEQPSFTAYYTPYSSPVQPDAAGYDLPLPLSEILNYADVDSKLDLAGVTSMLQENGFALMSYELGYGEPNNMVAPYGVLANRGIPIFVTSDTLLHLYHIQFDETLREIEEAEFYYDIRDLTAALLDVALHQYGQFEGDLREAARRNAAYLAVAQKLIDPASALPPLISDLVAAELAKIDAHEGFAPSDIFLYSEDYSQYIPRGHYTRSQILKQYFKTFMWLGRMTFLLKGSDPHGQTCAALISTYDARIQTIQAALLAQATKQIQVANRSGQGSRTGRDIWNRIYEVTAFYVGLADDLTPYEYMEVLNRIFGADFEFTDLESDYNYLTLKSELALLRSPRIFGGTGNVIVMPPMTSESLDEILDKTKGMRFMGQRFIPDSYMFQNLVFPAVGPYTGDAVVKPFTWGFTGVFVGRVFPRGLDAMALLGSDVAKQILIDEGDTDYEEYWLQFNQLKAEFDALSETDWNRNLYWSWLYSLKALLVRSTEGHPRFMHTEAWRKKQLNAALASWAELRHDTILYAKQSSTGGGGGMPPPPPPGYVEPVPEFFGRLCALTKMTREGLVELDALSVEAATRITALEDMLGRLIEIAERQLTNQPPTDDDNMYLKGFAASLQQTVTGVSDAAVATTLVADVHTDTNSEQVLEEGVGHVDLIVVACPHPTGGAFLAAGPVLSYYEFKYPMADRLTDEAWTEMLNSPNKPDRPAWYSELFAPVPVNR